tara:strand:- start:6321 stop:7061 length:741 start_codon:yes stop_codon:yes gene_type:complete
VRNLDTHALLTRVPIILLLFLCVIEITDLDFKIMGLLYDSQSHSFPLRHDWFTEGVLHTLGRQLVGTIGVGIILTFIGAYILPSLKFARWEWSFVVVSIVISTLTVSVLKKTTGMHCAYDLSIYGGAQPLNQLSNLWSGSGQCWPGGHVSGPFSLLAIYFAFRAKQPTFALCALIVAVTLGMSFGVGQTLRGAHFPSHTVWTVLIVWVINLLLARVMLPAPKPEVDRKEKGTTKTQMESADGRICA